MVRRGKNTFIMGDHNVISDYSGQKLKRSDCRYTWDGWLVGKDEWEPKQPQLDIKGRDEQIAVADTRPRGQDRFYTPSANEL